MPRPKKWKKVCCLPSNDSFAPVGIIGNTVVTLNVEEYETIRLIDLEGLKQEECAEHMKVARTTVQAMYESARKKIADFIVCGKVLQIEGGDYILCDGKSDFCGGPKCKKFKDSAEQK